MAQVTVEQLAEVVGASADRLLTQMKEAGLPHTEAAEVVSDEDKQTLLSFLKRSHGESTDAPKRITLKRKTLSTLRTSGSQGRKTVNVEVRKKRTYVKRDQSELEDGDAVAIDEELEVQEVEETGAVAEAAVAEAAAEAEAIAVAEAAAIEQTAAEEVLKAEEVDEDPANVDPEVLRQRAAARRKLKELEDAAARQAAAEARKAAEELVAAEAQAKKRADEGSKEATKRPKRLHDAPSSPPKGAQEHKKPGRLGRSAPGARRAGIKAARGGRKALPLSVLLASLVLQAVQIIGGFLCLAAGSKNKILVAF
jgi:translation initiation factor IF-2